MGKSKEKFTQGPWIVKHSEWEISVIRKDAPSGMPFAEVPICDISQEEDTGGLYDAALIASAPDMYEALRRCERYMTEKGCSHEYPVLSNARAVLEKARGENA